MQGSVNNPLRIDYLRRHLEGSIFGRNLIWHETVGSTNTVAKEMAARGAPEGTLVLTEEQTAGRGRLGRQWLSPSRANLLFSLLLRPALDAGEVFSLTMILALAAAEAVESACAVTPRIKWPNDLYVNGRKLGGLLTEVSAAGKTVEWAVLGLGLNVNWNPERGEGAAYAATSLLAESGRPVEREDLLLGILRSFDLLYGELRQGRQEPVYRRWNELSMLLGKTVEVASGAESVCGTALRIDPDGSLILEDARGNHQRVVCGDVTVKEIRERETGSPRH